MHIAIHAQRKPGRIAAIGLFALVMALPVPGAKAETYLGKVCLTSTITTRETGPVTPQEVTAEYDLTHLGGNSYALAGYINFADEPFVTTGHGMVIGNEFFLNVTTTQSHTDGWRDTGINQTRLNLSTMTGTFYEIGHDYSPVSSQWDTRYTAGTVAVTACP
ncbi:MAG: hypothetical protein ACOY3Z_06685 [Thermodesulfobacteriota bacterium]